MVLSGLEFHKIALKSPKPDKQETIKCYSASYSKKINQKEYKSVK